MLLILDSLKDLVNTEWPTEKMFYSPLQKLVNRYVSVKMLRKEHLELQEPMQLFVCVFCRYF